MMQKHTILMTLTGDTISIDSNLDIVNGYEVNYIQSLGGGIVNYSNVKGFISDPNNSIIANDFRVYLQGNTSADEFNHIYASDDKLAAVFNSYYISSVINNQQSSTLAIDEALSSTTGVTIVNKSIHSLSGVSPPKGLDSIPLSINNPSRVTETYSTLDTFTNESSYYIPVFIKRNFSQTDRERVYFDNIMKEINGHIIASNNYETI